MKTFKEDLRNRLETFEQFEKSTSNQQKSLEAKISSINQMTKNTSDKIKKLFIKEEILKKKKNCKI
jgi:hypothetical protein